MRRKPILGNAPRRRVIRTAVSAVAAIVIVASLPASSEARPGGKLVPKWGAMFGTTIGLKGSTGLSLSQLETMVGRKFEVVQRYYNWKGKFPTINERRDVGHGRIPMIAWRATSLQPIIQGSYDGLIRARARALKGLGHWVFLRWGWEMNGNWESWTGSANGGSGGGPRRFQEAWRHIHDIFSNVGAWNVVWVWAPNSEDVPRTSWNHFTNYYPGDAYVDWVGIDGFNWGTTQWWSRWRSIDSLVKRVYRTYRWRKPIMVAETGSVEQGGSKADWIRHAAATIKTNYPSIAAFMYYNGQDRTEPVDWKVTSSSSAISAFRAMGHLPYWAY